jgi:hypothetical protein
MGGWADALGRFRRLPSSVSRGPKEEVVHETYRMLGREHELDLEREARKRHLADRVRAGRGPAKVRAEAEQPRKWAWLLPRLLGALVR